MGNCRIFISVILRNHKKWGGTAPVPARPQPMVAGGRVLGEDGRGRAVTGPHSSHD